MALAKRRGVRNITWRQGEIERVPLRDGYRRRRHPFTGAAPRPDPERALSEAARIVSPGGHVLVLDLREHDQEWVTERLGDRWHGFSEEALEKLLAGAGLKDVKVTVGARRPGDPFTVLIASGRKPAEKTQKTR